MDSLDCNNSIFSIKVVYNGKWIILFCKITQQKKLRILFDKKNFQKHQNLIEEAIDCLYANPFDESREV